MLKRFSKRSDRKIGLSNVMNKKKFSNFVKSTTLQIIWLHQVSLDSLYSDDFNTN